jgi:hypothetical protein
VGSSSIPARGYTFLQNLPERIPDFTASHFCGVWLGCEFVGERAALCCRLGSNPCRVRPLRGQPCVMFNSDVVVVVLLLPLNFFPKCPYRICIRRKILRIMSKSRSLTARKEVKAMLVTGRGGLWGC